MQANIFGTGVDADLYTASYNSTLYLFTTMCYALCIASVPILTKEFADVYKRQKQHRARQRSCDGAVDGHQLYRQNL